MLSRISFLIGACVIGAILSVRVHAQVPISTPTPTHQPVPGDLVGAASSGNLELVKTLTGSHPEFINGTESQTPLGEAARNGQLEVARYLLEHGADPNGGSWGWTPLTSALLNNYSPPDWQAMADLLLEKGADVNGVKTGSSSTLQLVLQTPGDKRKKEHIIWLLAHGADIYASSVNGASLFDFAISQSSPDIAALVLAKVDVKHRDALGQTPLFTAVRTGNVDLSRILLERGANVNAQTVYGDTPLHLAAGGETGDLPNKALIQILLDAGANPNLPNLQGDLPLHLALRHEVSLDRSMNLISGEYSDAPNPYSIPNGIQVSALIEKTDVSKRDGNGLSSLMIAILARDVESRDLIHSRNPQNDSVTALFDAVVAGEPAKVEGYLKSKPYLSFVRLPDGSTPLHIAALWGRLGCAEVLVKRGADTKAHDGRGLTPLHYAVRNPIGQFSRRALNIITFLIAKGADPNAAAISGDSPLHLAARSGNPQIINLLLGKGAHINARGAFGDTALLILTNRSTDLKFYRTLIARGADVNARGVVESAEAIFDSDGARHTNALVKFPFIRYSTPHFVGSGTPLHRAVLTGRSDLSSALLENGADIEATDGNGKTPLALAVTSANHASSEVVRFLLSKGANPNARAAIASDGLLSYAIQQSTPAMVRALLTSPQIANKARNVTPVFFAWAVSVDHLEAVRALLEAGVNPNSTDNSGKPAINFAYSPDMKNLLNQFITQRQKALSMLAAQK